MAKKKKTTWGDVPASENTGKFWVDQPGVYNFVVEEAWDSILAPEGSYDYERLQKKDMRYIGLMGKVVGNNDQEGRHCAVDLYLNKDKNMQTSKWVLEEVLNMEIDPDMQVDEPMSVGEIVGQYFKSLVEMEKIGEGENERVIPKIAFFNIEKADEKYADENERRQLTLDQENESTVKHYEAEEARRSKREKSHAGEVDDDDEMDDLPF